MISLEPGHDARAKLVLLKHPVVCCFLPGVARFAELVRFGPEVEGFAQEQAEHRDSEKTGCRSLGSLLHHSSQGTVVLQAAVRVCPQLEGSAVAVLAEVAWQNFEP